MRFLNILAFLCLLPLALHAGDFDLSASASKTELELGETFTLQIVVSSGGNFAFNPQLQTPTFDGFQVQGGPRQGQQMNWVNGVVNTKFVLEWDLAPLKSGTLTLGPFHASATDASQGALNKASVPITIHVAKAKGNILPPTPTPDTSGGAPSQDADALRDIKGDLGFPWGKAALLLAALLSVLGFAAWFWLKPQKPKKIPVVRDPGQVALMDLEKAREILARGDEEAYYLELARIIRFYLRHRLRRPDKELTLLESERLVERALGAESAGQLEPLARLQELLFAGTKPQAKDADSVRDGLRGCILKLEKGASWKSSEIAKAQLEHARELYADKGGEAYFKALGAVFKELLGSWEESLGPEGLQERIAKGLEALGPAAASRVSVILLSKRMPEDMDLDKLCKELQRLADTLEGSQSDGK